MHKPVVYLFQFSESATCDGNRVVGMQYSEQSRVSLGSYTGRAIATRTFQRSRFGWRCGGGRLVPYNWRIAERIAQRQLFQFLLVRRKELAFFDGQVFHARG